MNITELSSQIPAKKGGRENYKYYDVDGLGNMERVSLNMVKEEQTLKVLPADIFVELAWSN